eukprot:647299-Prymnesium_polylepis.1
MADRVSDPPAEAESRRALGERLASLELLLGWAARLARTARARHVRQSCAPVVRRSCAPVMCGGHVRRARTARAHHVRRPSGGRDRARDSRPGPPQPSPP